MTTQLTIATPTTEALQQAIAKAELSQATRDKYSRVARRAVAAGVNLFDANSVRDFMQSISPGQARNFRSVYRLLLTELQFQAENSADDLTVPLELIQRTSLKISALKFASVATKKTAHKKHTWLTPGEVRLLTTCPDDTPTCQRNRVLFALAVSTGLRRDELARTRWEHIDEIDGTPVLRVIGKYDNERFIPLGAGLMAILDQWAALAGRKGAIIRQVSQKGDIGGALSGSAIFKIIKRAGAKIGKPGLAPHDLRRSFAEVCYQETNDLYFVSGLMGHSSIETTRKYLQAKPETTRKPSDYFQFG